MEIQMGKSKRVGDSAMVTDLGDGMLAIGKPDVALNPMTNKLERIKTVVTTDRETTCPMCKQKNPPGIEITETETGLLIYACKQCSQFVWCKEMRWKRRLSLHGHGCDEKEGEDSVR